jgi:hypothetical protein
LITSPSISKDRSGIWVIMAGLVPTSDLQASRTIAKLSRQMRILLDRIDTLDNWLNHKSQLGHEDLEAEAVYSFATWEMANEFCADLPPTEGCPNGPENGTGPKSGTVSVAAGSHPDAGRSPPDDQQQELL